MLVHFFLNNNNYNRNFDGGWWVKATWQPLSSTQQVVPRCPAMWHCFFSLSTNRFSHLHMQDLLVSHKIQIFLISGQFFCFFFLNLRVDVKISLQHCINFFIFIFSIKIVTYFGDEIVNLYAKDNFLGGATDI